MALFEKLSASSSPQEIADAYKEFTGLAGGDTAAVQKQAVDYLSGLGIATPTIEQSYGLYLNPVTSNLPTTLATSADTTTTSNLPTTLATSTGVGTSTDTTTTSNLPTTLTTSADVGASTGTTAVTDTTGGVSTLNNLTAAPTDNITYRRR